MIKKWCSECRKRTSHKKVKEEQAEAIDFENPLTVTSQEIAKARWVTYECEKCGTQILEGEQ